MRSRSLRSLDRRSFARCLVVVRRRRGSRHATRPPRERRAFSAAAPVTGGADGDDRGRREPVLPPRATAVRASPTAASPCGPDGGSTCVNGVAVAPPRSAAEALSRSFRPRSRSATTPVPPLERRDAARARRRDDGRGERSGSRSGLRRRSRDQRRARDGDAPGRRRAGPRSSRTPRAACTSPSAAAAPSPRIDPKTGDGHRAAGRVLGAARARLPGGTEQLVTSPARAASSSRCRAAGGAATRTLTLDRDLRDVVVGANGSLLVSTFRKAEVLVVGADGTVSSRLRPGSGLVPSSLGQPADADPVGGVAHGAARGRRRAASSCCTRRASTTRSIRPAGGYAGLKGCGGIVEAGVSVLTPGRRARRPSRRARAWSRWPSTSRSRPIRRDGRRGPRQRRDARASRRWSRGRWRRDDADPAAATFGVTGASPSRRRPAGQVVAVALHAVGRAARADARAGGALARGHGRR